MERKHTGVVTQDRKAIAAGSAIAERGRCDLKNLGDAGNTDRNPILSRRWQTEEESPSGVETWGIVVQAVRYKDEELIGLCWVPVHDPGAPTATACFHCEAAVALLRTLYSAFAALDDPDDYLRQIGLCWTTTGRRPSAGIVGSAQDFGGVQAHVDWGSEPRLATLMIHPSDGLSVHATLGIASVAHLVQLISAAFEALNWPIPA